MNFALLSSSKSARISSSCCGMSTDEIGVVVNDDGRSGIQTGALMGGAGGLEELFNSASGSSMFS